MKWIDDWIQDRPIDAEFKRYKALSRTKSLEESLDKGEVYPSLSRATEEYFHLKHLSKFLESTVPVEKGRKVEVVLDHGSVEVVESVGGDNGDLITLLEASRNAIPEFERVISRGKNMYQEEVNTIEVSSLRADEGAEGATEGDVGERYACVLCKGSAHLYRMTVDTRETSASVKSEVVESVPDDGIPEEKQAEMLARSNGWFGPVTVYRSVSGYAMEGTVMPVVKQFELQSERNLRVIPRKKRAMKGATK